MGDDRELADVERDAGANWAAYYRATLVTSRAAVRSRHAGAR
jgi:hypothetical protein